MGSEAARLMVDFVALDGGDAPLTWGQQTIWRPIQWYGEDDHYFNVFRVVRLPAGTTVPGLLEVLRHLIVEQQSLRNVFTYVDGVLWQRVLRTGAVRVDVHEAGAESAARRADAIAERLCAERFEVGDAPTVRMAVVRDGAHPAYLVLVASHLVLDGWAIGQLAERVLAALGDGPVADQNAGTERWGPLEQAAYEATEEARRQSDSAIAWWRQHLMTMSATLFDTPRGRPEAERWVRLDLLSPALAAAAQLLADRLRVSTSTVLMVATAAATAELTGTDRWALQLIAGNRQTLRRRLTLDAAAQNALFVLDPADDDFDTIVRRAYRVATLAYSRAYYDPQALDATVAAVARERGHDVQLTTYFNDARGGHDRWDGLDLEGCGPDELRAMRGASRIVRSGGWRRQDCHFFMHVHYLADRCHLRLLADTAFVPTPLMSAVLTGVESVVVAAATTTLTPTEVTSLLDLRGR